MCFTTFIFCPLGFTFYQIWYMWYMKRRKWYMCPIFCPKLTSNHVILQVSVYMRDTCLRSTLQRWRSYHIFFYFNDFLYILKKKSWVAVTPILAKGVAEPPSRYHFWYLFKPQGAHHKIYKTIDTYWKKKLCLSNKHLVIF
jgi:hypothetical protein